MPYREKLIKVKKINPFVHINTRNKSCLLRRSFVEICSVVYCVILLTEENRFPESCKFREVENKSHFPPCCPYYDELRKSILHEQMFWCIDDGRLEWSFNLTVYLVDFIFISKSWGK